MNITLTKEEALIIMETLGAIIESGKDAQDIHDMFYKKLFEQLKEKN